MKKKGERERRKRDGKPRSLALLYIHFELLKKRDVMEGREKTPGKKKEGGGGGSANPHLLPFSSFLFLAARQRRRGGGGKILKKGEEEKGRTQISLFFSSADRVVSSGRRAKGKREKRSHDGEKEKREESSVRPLLSSFNFYTSSPSLLNTSSLLMPWRIKRGGGKKKEPFR